MRVLITVDDTGWEAKVLDQNAAILRQWEGGGRVFPVPACAYSLSSGLCVRTVEVTTIGIKRTVWKKTTVEEKDHGSIHNQELQSPPVDQSISTNAPLARKLFGFANTSNSNSNAVNLLTNSCIDALASRHCPHVISVTKPVSSVNFALRVLYCLSAKLIDLSRS